MKGIVISVVLLLVGLSGASAQSLADVAKKEKERREALGSTKAETHDDSTLAARRRAMPPSRRPTDLAAGATAEPGEPSEETEEGLDAQGIEEEDPTQTQAYWRDRKAGIDRRIADVEAQLNAPGFTSDPDNLLRRNQLEGQLEQARSDLTALQAEARSQGIPPGWIR